MRALFQEPLVVPGVQFILAELHAMKLDGVLHHVYGEAFLPTGVGQTPELRAAALALAVPASLAKRAIVGQLSAAWIYGCAPSPQPLALLLDSGGKSALLPPLSGCSLRQVHVSPAEVSELAGAHVTNPLRTAVDVARSAPLPVARAVLEAMAAQPELACSVGAIMAELSGAAHVPGRIRGLALLRGMGTGS